MDQVMDVAVRGAAAAARPLADTPSAELDRPPDHRGDRLAKADVQDNRLAGVRLAEQAPASPQAGTAFPRDELT